MEIGADWAGLEHERSLVYGFEEFEACSQHVQEHSTRQGASYGEQGLGVRGFGLNRQSRIGVRQ